MSPEVDETFPTGLIEQGVIALAQRKLEAAAPKAGSHIALAADTVVVIDDQPLGKPTDREDAIRLLTILAGREHRVVTGFCVRGQRDLRRAAVSTQVRFRPLGKAEIVRYVESGEPMDKAGAYGIQGLGGALVDRIEGSYTNVVGLPLREVIEAVEAVA